MAEPPQIEEPTPTRVASFVSRLNKRWKKKATIKAIEMVERITGREDFFKLHSLVVTLLTALPVGEEESNRDNSQGACQFDNSSRLESIALVKTIPGASSSCHRGSIVDCSTRKESKTVVGKMEPRT